MTSLTDVSELPTFALDLFVLFVGMMAYILPSLVASRRGHHNAGAICALNLLLGWTVLGWVIALVWALTEPAAGRT